jgi:hypothetical protein
MDVWSLLIHCGLIHTDALQVNVRMSDPYVSAAAVFMGMGEPLLNIPAVVAAATYLREQLGMSGRSITISTVGKCGSLSISVPLYDTPVFCSCCGIPVMAGMSLENSKLQYVGLTAQQLLQVCGTGAERKISVLVGTI